jgi:hypothetical protein
MSGVSNTQRLRSLIQAVRDAHGWSYDKIAEQTGGRLAKSGVHNMATQQVRTDPLPVEHMRALADGLRVPYERVREAALADAGLLEISDHEILPETTVLAAAMRDMTPEKRREYMEMALRLAEPFKSDPSNRG